MALLVRIYTLPVIIVNNDRVDDWTAERVIIPSNEVQIK